MRCWWSRPCSSSRARSQRRPGRGSPRWRCSRICLLGQIWLAAPRIEEGHNVFIVDGEKGSALAAGLPAEVFAFMRTEFDAKYPPERRCDPKNFGCWRGQGFPKSAFAFSADGIHDASRLFATRHRLSISPIRSGCGSASSTSTATTGSGRRHRARHPRPPLARAAASLADRDAVVRHVSFPRRFRRQ